MRTKGRSWIWAQLAVLLFAVSFSSMTWAYVPPSSFLVKSLANKRLSLKTIRWKSILTSGEWGLKKFKVITAFDVKVQKLRVRVTDESGVTLLQKEEILGLDLRHLPFALLTQSSTDELLAQLKKAEVPVKSETELLELPDEDKRRAAEVLAIGRLKQSSGSWVYSWNIGNQASQLWLEKDTFLPLRIRLPLSLTVNSASASESAPAYEVRYEGFRYYKEIPMPRVISYLKAPVASATTVLAVAADTEWVREEISEVFMNTELPEMKGDWTAEEGAAAFSSLDSKFRDRLTDWMSRVR